MEESAERPVHGVPYGCSVGWGWSGVQRGDGHSTAGGDCGLLAELAGSLSHLPGCPLASLAVAAVDGKRGGLPP